MVGVEGGKTDGSLVRRGGPNVFPKRHPWDSFTSVPLDIFTRERPYAHTRTATPTDRQRVYKAARRNAEEFLSLFIHASARNLILEDLLILCYTLMGGVTRGFRGPVTRKDTYGWSEGTGHDL